jgi:hypothetical protein
MGWLLQTACSDAGNRTQQNAGSMGAGDAGGNAGWCDVAPIIEAKCQRCHRDPPENAAPFALLDYDDTQVMGSVPRYQVMRSMVSAGFMPPVTAELSPPVEPLTCSEKTTLLSWLDAGAPAPSRACSEVTPVLLPCE